MARFVICVFFAIFAHTVQGLANLEEVFTWKELSFAWPNEKIKQEWLASGDYVPKNNLPLGLDRWRNKLFVTVPRWKNGVASTLGYVSLDQPINKTAPLIPYPSWEANTLPKNGEKPKDDNFIVSVFRIAVDSCDRLWVMDTGLADILGEPNVVSQPALIIYDLKTDSLIRRFRFKGDDLKQESFFANVVVDVQPNQCDNAFAYIPDLGGYGLVVYSFKDNDSWRFKHNFFHFDPLEGDFNVGGVNFQWTDGIFGVALSPADSQGFRTVYFHPLASLNEFSVNSRILRNKTSAHDPHIYYEFKLEGVKGEKSQTSASVFDDKTNTLLLTQLNRDGVACWNPKKELKPENVELIVQDNEKLVFTNDIKIDNERNLWILSDKMPQFLYRSLNDNEVNYRIMRVNIDEAISGTVCQA